MGNRRDIFSRSITNFLKIYQYIMHDTKDSYKLISLTTSVPCMFVRYELDQGEIRLHTSPIELRIV